MQETVNTSVIVAGPTAFITLGPGRLCSGPIRATLEEAREDAEKLDRSFSRVPRRQWFALAQAMHGR